MILSLLSYPTYAETLLLDACEKMTCPKSEKTLEEIKKENDIIYERSKQTTTLYAPPLETNQIKNITTEVINHAITHEAAKKHIARYKRKFYLFSYPSDNYQIKAFISLAEHFKDKPVIIYLRGGNRIFGLPHPNLVTDFNDYTVIVTTYRGGVSEGIDQFGGEDVNDIPALMNYLPTLDSLLELNLNQQKKYMVSVSRGTMQMFLALERYPELQLQIDKAVAVTGLFDIGFALEDRPDFKTMLEENFNLTAENQTQWLYHRDTIKHADKISNKLPILIAQGAKDSRVCYVEGLNMLHKLRNQSAKVTYWEEPEGDHGLSNATYFPKMLIDWLER